MEDVFDYILTPCFLFAYAQLDNLSYHEFGGLIVDLHNVQLLGG